MREWEACDEGDLAQLLVGDYYGDHPRDKLDAIRASKKNRAARLCRMLGCHGESVVLEVGSGMGFTSKHVAGVVKRLYCCDISTSFLNAARKECSGVTNIQFFEIDDEKRQLLPGVDESFDAIFADAVFIHLNLYDIFWYFSEFQRLAKPRGKVFVNVLNASNIDAAKFSEMAAYYRRRRASLDTLLCWNSIAAVVTIAARFGFALTWRGLLSRLRSGRTVNLLFVKR